MPSPDNSNGYTTPSLQVQKEDHEMNHFEVAEKLKWVEANDTAKRAAAKKD